MLKAEHCRRRLFIYISASHSQFTRAFKQVYGFGPPYQSRERFLKESKIRQDLLANAGYNLGKLPESANPDRFRVRVI